MAREETEFKLSPFSDLLQVPVIDLAPRKPDARSERSCRVPTYRELNRGSKRRGKGWRQSRMTSSSGWITDKQMSLQDATAAERTEEQVGLLYPSTDL